MWNDSNILWNGHKILQKLIFSVGRDYTQIKISNLLTFSKLKVSVLISSVQPTSQWANLASANIHLVSGAALDCCFYFTFSRQGPETSGPCASLLFQVSQPATAVIALYHTPTFVSVSFSWKNCRPLDVLLHRTKLPYLKQLCFLLSR